MTTVLVGLLAFLIALRPAVDNDLWFHLRTARWMLDHHAWVGADPFTHTRPDVVRVQTDWLSQLGYYGVWRWTGLAGVAIAVAGVATTAMVVLYRALPGSTRLRAGVVVLTAATSSIFWSARPQMITFLGTALTIALWLHWRRRPEQRFLWWLVPGFLVWVNAHGGVIYGVLILFGVVGGEVVALGLRRAPLPIPALRRLLAVTASCLAVLAVNPSGWRVYGLAFHQVAASTQFVQEYQPPSLGDPTALPFFVMLAGTAVLLVWRWRDWNPVELFLVAGGAAFAVQYTRSVPFFAVLAAPALARNLSAVRSGGPATVTVTDRRRADPGLVVTVAVVAVFLVLTSTARLAPEQTNTLVAAEFPVAAVAWLETEQPAGELFNTFEWGGYVMWEAPDYRVSVDGRTDVYDEYLDVYDDTIRARAGWQGELDREGIGTVLVDPGLPLTAALRADASWRVAYEDPVAVAFTRIGPVPEPG